MANRTAAAGGHGGGEMEEAKWKRCHKQQQQSGADYSNSMDFGDKGRENNSFGLAGFGLLVAANATHRHCTGSF
jgi:hypothetical protein